MDHQDEAGLFFEYENGARVKAALRALNDPRTLKAITPAGLAAGSRTAS